MWADEISTVQFLFSDNSSVFDFSDHSSANFAVTIFDSKIYVLGGEGQKGIIVQSVEVYDPIVNKWKEAGTLPKPKRYHAALAMHGKLWSSGGTNSLIEAKSTGELMLETDTRKLNA